MYKTLIFVGLLTWFAACTAKKERTIKIPDNRVEADIHGFEQKNGLLFYDNQPFSGYRYTNYPNGKTATMLAYWQGKKEAKSEAFYLNGHKRYQKFYHKGKRFGTHTGWHNNGQMSFVRRYQNGLREGVQKNYHKNGQLWTEKHYKKGKEQGTQKEWSQGGRLVSNYVMKKGRRYGVLGRKNCVSVYKKPKTGN